jgi:hypothetical protein
MHPELENLLDHDAESDPAGTSPDEAFTELDQYLLDELVPDKSAKRPTEPPRALHRQTRSLGRLSSYNTVHLTVFVAFCIEQGQEATGCAYDCGTPPGCPDHGLHQSWRNHKDISSFGYWPGAFKDRNSPCSSA